MTSQDLNLIVESNLPFILAYYGLSHRWSVLLLNIKIIKIIQKLLLRDFLLAHESWALASLDLLGWRRTRGWSGVAIRAAAWAWWRWWRLHSFDFILEVSEKVATLILENSQNLSLSFQLFVNPCGNAVVPSLIPVSNLIGVTRENSCAIYLVEFVSNLLKCSSLTQEHTNCDSSKFHCSAISDEN